MLRFAWLALAFVPALSHAQMALPFDIASVEIHQITDGDKDAVAITDTTCSAGMEVEDLPGIGLGTIVTVGSKVWQLIEAGKPVVSVDTPMVAALPDGLNCWTDLDSWQPAKFQSYEVTYKNLLGVTVVDFRFRLQFSYGGGRGGVGKYLANVTVVPGLLDVVWGYDFAATVDVGQALNVGTAQDPVAGLNLDLKWTVKTVFKESQNSFNFYVQGDGLVQAVN